MKVIQVSDRLSIGSQPSLSELNELRSSGFGAVINNRPDGEEPSQPASSDSSRKAATLGMAYVHQPVTLAGITENDIRKFQKTLASQQAPVFAHCKSGTRSLTLWVLGEVLDGRLRPSEIITFGKQYGLDLKAAQDWAAANVKPE